MHLFFVPFTKKREKAGDKHTHVHTQQVLGRRRKFKNLDPRTQAPPTYADHTPRPPNRAASFPRRKKEPNLSFRSFCATFPDTKRRKTLAVHASRPCREDGMESVGTHGPLPVAAPSTTLARTYSRTNATVNVWRNERYRGATREQRRRSEVARRRGSRVAYLPADGKGVVADGQYHLV